MAAEPTTTQRQCRAAGGLEAMPFTYVHWLFASTNLVAQSYADRSYWLAYRYFCTGLLQARPSSLTELRRCYICLTAVHCPLLSLFALPSCPPPLALVLQSAFTPFQPHLSALCASLVCAACHFGPGFISYPLQIALSTLKVPTASQRGPHSLLTSL